MADAITIHNLVKQYPNLTAVNDISFSIKKGEFFGLLGPNGAGKTTTIGILTGLVNKTSGDVKLFGKDVVTQYKDARGLIGLVPQEFNFDQFETVYNIMFFNAGYFGIPTSQRAKKIENVLRELTLWEKRDTKARTLSGGMKRKLMIARALMHNPKILILDEPTAGVDVETRKAMYEYFRTLNKRGITILLTTHYLEEAEELCDRIGIINNGKIVKIDHKKNLLSLLERERIRIVLKEKQKQLPKEFAKFDASLEERGSVITVIISTKNNQWQKLLTAIQKAKLDVDKIETHETSLEEIFLHLTKK